MINHPKISERNKKLISFFLILQSMNFPIAISQPLPTTMTDLAPDPGPSKSATDALPPPANPLSPAVQSNLVPLNSAPPTIDPYQDAIPTGTQVYRTLYSVSFLPTTKIDHDHDNQRINGLCMLPQWVQCNKKYKVSKSLNMGIHSIGVIWHPGTQPYTAMYNDPPSASTCYHVIALTRFEWPWQCKQQACTDETIQTKDGAATMTIGGGENNRITPDEPPEGSWWTEVPLSCASLWAWTKSQGQG